MNARHKIQPCMWELISFHDCYHYHHYWLSLIKLKYYLLLCVCVSLFQKCCKSPQLSVLPADGHPPPPQEPVTKRFVHSTSILCINFAFTILKWLTRGLLSGSPCGVMSVRHFHEWRVTNVHKMKQCRTFKFTSATLGNVAHLHIFRPYRKSSLT